MLDRLAPNGEVAHEEDIGEFAVLRNAREGRGRVATPVYDYGMVDDDFLLAPLAARWLLSEEGARARAIEFLAEQRSASANATEPRSRAISRGWSSVRRLLPTIRARRISSAIKSGRMTGQWRDSEQGLGRGRYAYDVNAALVPAALDAIARLHESGILDEYVDADQRRTLAQARARAHVWTARAAAFFAVDVPTTRARAATSLRTRRKSGVDGARARRDLRTAPLAFHALSLDEQGRPIPILHSDEGFRLLLTEPAPEELARCLGAIMRPFPAGLMTDVGLLVANPALASAELRREFTRFAYHGTVVWSWQQALLAAGIERQLQRVDLPKHTRAQLEQARADLVGGDRIDPGPCALRSCGRGRLQMAAIAWSRLAGPAPTRMNRTPRSSGARCSWASSPPVTRDTSPGN